MTQSNKWTPGPWTVNRDHTVSIPYRGRHCVASAYAGTKANALLVAAAPEMVESLDVVTDLLAFIVNHATLPDGLYQRATKELEQSRSILKTARGES